MSCLWLDHVHAQLQGCEINFSSTKMQTIRRIFARIQTVTEAEPVRIFTLRRGEKLIKRRRIENGVFLYLIQWSKVIVFICGIKHCSCCSLVKQPLHLYNFLFSKQERSPCFTCGTSLPTFVGKSGPFPLVSCNKTKCVNIFEDHNFKTMHWKMLAASHHALCGHVWKKTYFNSS